MSADAIELVRHDLMATARGMRCLVRTIKTASTAEEWTDIAHDFSSMHWLASSRAVAFRSATASEAADHLSRGNVKRAVAVLAGASDMTSEFWLELGRMQFNHKARHTR